MSEWLRIIKLYLDTAKAGGVNPLLSAKTSAGLSATPAFVVGDRFTLELWLREISTSPLSVSTAKNLQAGDKIVLCGRLASDLSTAILFSTYEWAETGTGDDLRYTGVVNLDTDAARAALEAAAGNSITVRVDVEVEDENNEARLTFQFNVTLYRQAYDGEGAPAPIAPAAPLGRWKSGAIQIKNVTTGLFHPMWLEGAGGPGEVRFGEGEE
jgi:hypothetical protein